ncbi:MAG: F0F1 ATP synthase subunit A [Verrucomicrobiia bacterium]|jgi:F-type H+-transporting ATPase subunit a
MSELFHVDQWVWMVWISGALTVLVFVLGARLIAASRVVAGRFAVFVEVMVDFARENIAEAFLGEHAKKWFGFIATLFFFILFANLLGKLPGPVTGSLKQQHFWLETPTGNINVTSALAVMVFLVAQTTGLMNMGLVGYLRKKFLLPAPKWVQIPAIPIMFLVLLAEPFSLAVRLFANMTAGHRVIVTFMVADMVGGMWLVQQAPIWAKPISVLPFVLTVVLLAFELFIAFIQAFIFALLSALYLSESLEEHH